MGFEIDCANTVAMNAALDILIANSCETDCSSDLCVLNYYIVQAHHDYCPEENIPERIEDAFHDYDDVCEECEITRAFTEGAPACPAVSCEDSSGTEAYGRLVDNGCLTDCSSQTCKDAFLTLRTVHDSCDHEVLSEAAEKGLHDFEVPCEYACNLPDAPLVGEPLMCEEEDHDDHGDEEGHSCACEADELDFEIDCANTGAMLFALQELQAAGCASDCSSAACTRNFFIVQSHHDYCPEDGIPTEIEDGFHDFEEACEHCEVSRFFVDGAPDCPAIECEDGSGNEAYARLLVNGCQADCSSQACIDDFLILRTVHDLCDHEDLTEAAEDGLHDFEESCILPCNLPNAKEPLVCMEDDDEEPVTEPSPSAASVASSTMAAAAIGAAAMIL